MEHLNVFRIKESDFDGIIRRIGGRRLSEDESREELKNADYVLDDAVIELKIVEEEPSMKATKQGKLALLFGKDTETVVIDPQVLDEDGRKRYYRIMETPIKQHVKKAARQLKRSKGMLGLQGPRIAVLVNNGLYAMSSEEFESRAFKCAANDTSAIDILLVGGVYCYSDTFDMYLFPELASFYINGDFGCKAVQAIRTGWDEFVESYMRSVIVDTSTDRTKEPVKEISFERAGVRYVKAAPRFPASTFWPGGVRPRMDSTGQDACPPVATVLPLFSPKAYHAATAAIIDKERLHGTLIEYNQWCRDQMSSRSNPLCPIVGFELSPAECTSNWYADLCCGAARDFNRYLRGLLDRALPWSETHVSLNYTLITSHEIGIDKANDLAWISLISEVPGFEKKLEILCAKRMKVEYALALGGAYAILHRCPQVYYLRERMYPPGETVPMVPR